MAPTRWIEFYRRREKRDTGAILRPRKTIFNNLTGAALRISDFFLVPGGRYLVIYSPRILPRILRGTISVLDLYTSADLIASVELPVEAKYHGWNVLTVRPTPDGLGLTIFLSNV